MGLAYLMTSRMAGHALRRERLRAGKTLEDVATDLSIQRASIGAIENGMPVELSRIRKLLAYYRVTPEEAKRILDLASRSHRRVPSLKRFVPWRDGPASIYVDSKEVAIQAFLCHSSVDKDDVHMLYSRLRRDGINCWFDEADLLPGQDWELEVSKAIRKVGTSWRVYRARQFQRPGICTRN